MIRGRGVAVAAGVVAACSSTADPCAGMATCVRLDVDSLGIPEVDQLELDVVYADLHATTTTGTPGQRVSLPFSIPLTIDLPSPLQIPIELVVAGKLGGIVVGADTGSTTVIQGNHAAIAMFLEPVQGCTEGGVYCGGTFDLLRDGETLYRCTGGIPTFYARCSHFCSPHFADDAVCVGAGLCRDGGTYCGGNLLDGDPGTLYVCMGFQGTTPRPCPAGCVIHGDGADTCK